MKLIKELNEELEYLEEAKENGAKEHYITGIFMQAEQKNRNGRWYSLPVMQSAVDDYNARLINDNRAYGELGHPAGPQINLDRVSHLIVELKRDGNNFIGKAKLIDTPMGNIAKGIMKSGGKLGVSSRGLGSLKEKNGLMEVQNDFHLATAADLVADPSAPNAFVEGVMEGVDWVYNSSDDSWHQELVHNTKHALKRMKMDEIEQQKFSLFEGFLNSLSTKNRTR